MMPGLINNSVPLPRPGASGRLPKLAGEDVTASALPLPPLQPQVGVAAGFRKTASQIIAGARSRSNPVQSEVVSKPMMLQNFQLATERAAVPYYGSSGSEHDPSSVSLFAMVHEFIENEGAGEQTSHLSAGHGFLTGNNKENPNVNGAANMPQTIQSLALCVDSTEEMLLRETQLILSSIAAEVRHLCDGGKPATVTHSCLKRTVMGRLQEMGYIAAICKTKWDHLCNIPAGDYEYIDVLLAADVHQSSKRQERLLVDIEFQAQFEIARPTHEFMAIWQCLPSVFVGRPERLKQIVRMMSEATKQSMRDTGLHLPPWRKPGYMKAKWFSSYKRTSNISPGRLCREGGHHPHHANGLGLAIRGGGLDARYTNSFEMLYHDAGSKFLMCSGKDAALSRRERDEITVIATDWQPPAVVPRSMVPRNKQSAITGLASLLSHAATPSCYDTLVHVA